MSRKILLIALTIIAQALLPTKTAALEAGYVQITEDSYVQSNYPHALPWDNRNFYIGYDTHYGKGRTRAFFKYDFDSVNSVLPGNDRLVEAKLMIYEYVSSSSEQYTVNLHRPSTGWSEKSLNWNSQPPTQYKSSTIWGNGTGWKAIDVTDLVADDLEQGVSYGIALTYQNENSPGGIFWSTSCRLAPDAPICQDGQQPYITISYDSTPPNQPPSAPILISPNNELVTNDEEVTFSWEKSTDPENDSIYYKLQIARDAQFEDVIIDPGLKAQSSILIDLSVFDDGTFYWAVMATDRTNDPARYVLSEINSFAVDRTAPDIPVIEPLPPFNGNDWLILKWLQPFDANHGYPLLFEIEQTAQKDPESATIHTTDEQFIKLTDLEEIVYCLRVRTTDYVGNSSDWSDGICIQQDYSYPRISGFSIDEQFLSPYSSPGVQDLATIKYDITEQNIKDARIIVLDKNHNEILQSQLTGNSGEVRFPADQYLIDGKYFAYLIAADQTGKYSRTDFLEIYIDNYPPMIPKIEIMDFRKIYNQSDIPIRVLTEQYTHNEMFLNDEEIEKWHKQPVFNYSLKNRMREGQNIIRVITTNRYGNSATGHNILLYDSIPPGKPTLDLLPSSNMLHGRIFGKDYRKAYIYNNAGLHKVVNATSSNVVLETSLIGNTNYSYTVILEDEAGNKSIASDKKSYYHSSINPLSSRISSTQFFNKTSAIKMSEQICTISINRELRKVALESCTLQKPRITKVHHSALSDTEFLIQAEIAHNPEFKLIFIQYECTPRSLFDPRTWFGCVERVKRTGSIFSKSVANFSVQVEGEKKQISTINSSPDNLYKVDFKSTKDLGGRKLSVTASAYLTYAISEVSTIKIGRTTPSSNPVAIPKAVNVNTSGENKPFRFPFARHIGVTQWYGDTKYQKPHRGIDFGAYREKLYAMADGYIVRAGWENTSNRCLSGGNVMLIKHDNGYHTLYAHMENFNKSNGTLWKVGERVKRGDQIGLSGNTGLYNCKKLGYHLHLETRTKAAWKSDVNPVPLIDVDWNLIPTLGVKANPGRLTGQNPHPEF